MKASSYLQMQVSDHAVTRYVQRILNIDVGPVAESLTSRQLAQMHCQAAGITIERARADIMSTAVAAAILMGASIIQTSRLRAMRSADGVVTTVLPPLPRRRQKS